MCAQEWNAVREDAVDTLRRYIQFDTTNPPGNELPAARWLKDQLIERGITRDVAIHEPAPGRGLVLARVAGSEPLKPLVLNHHIDVVPADPQLWTHPPFAGEVAEGYVWGRGTLDTKGLGIVHMLALQRLIEEGATFRRPVILLAVPDEEVGGGQGMAWAMENLFDQLDPEWVWDEGGFGFTGLWGDQAMFGVAVAEKKIHQLRLIASGEPGHGSMPHDDNANVTLMRALDRLMAPRPMRINEVTGAMFRALAKTQSFPLSFLLRQIGHPLVLRLAGRRLASVRMLNAMLRDTISLTMLEAGYKINVIPERAEAGIDCRLLPDTDADAFRRWVETTIDDDRITLETIETSPPTSISPIESPFLTAVTRALAKHVPDAVVFPLQTPGGTDSRFFRARGVPAYGLAPAITPLSELERVHGIDERLSIENLELGIKLSYEIIRKLCVD